MSRILEMGMLVCFGFAWPINIYKSLTTKSAKGKSVWFLVVIWVGYLCGIFNKIFFNYDFVLWFYVVNIVMVSIDIALYLRNRHLDMLAAREEGEPLRRVADVKKGS